MRLAAILAVALLPNVVAAQSISVALTPIQADGKNTAGIGSDPSTRADMLPDGGLSFASGAIREAWLTLPTTRYAHAVLGDAIEAGGISVRTSGNTIMSHVLSTDSVFEDRIARIVRIDGEDAVLSVKSYLDRGAALALMQIDRNSLRIAAESFPIGTAHRWLNPVGVADFDGDRRDEIAAILTPHIGGLLTLYRREGSILKQIYQQNDFSNHAIGSRELGWSAIVDANGDGIADIVAPDARRARLRIVTFANGRFAELARIALPSELSASFVVERSPTQSQSRILLGLADGQTYALTFAPR